MSDEEITPNNSMDIDLAPNESSSSSVPATSSVILDIGIGSGDISDSDDEDIHEPTQSKSSTPDSTTILTTVTRKPITTHKPSFTKNKSSLVNYEPESDDEEHTDDEEEENIEIPYTEDDPSNSNSPVILQRIGESDFVQTKTPTCNEQTIVTSDLLNVTPFKQEESSPTSRNDLTPNYPLIFPEDVDIRIPSEPNTNCPPRLEKKFEEYYKKFKKTGVDQNVRIQELKDFRNPCMYEKMISHLDIDEIGTNFPQELYDPHWWGKESYYEELSKAQKLEIDRREKERKERTKIGFTPGVKKIDQLGVGSSNNSDMGGEKRRTRFDQ
ncbi:unnamed protein product [Rotaria socialis]|uniref:SAP30-binding protein n=1 Tax=Rotaria socialis TaxID=392032 RepID=A0A817LF34_9BILA|nr:unnamed protein product [Rotaria socialis]CAF3245436.1 unnamed protein product [Rotaria socialis]CAF3333104.1 unnamed protein product [Rotaria socialis]CAF3553522.1 unnamed protein product [Rotaria socialis]CAF4154060.1 unnamed protein product [Rotaria socialis]